MDFLALFVSLPTRQTAGRMRIWRALRALGCATLRDGVYLLPDSGKHVAALDEVAAEVRAAQGMADVFLLGGRDESQQAAIIALFDRATDYAALLATMGRTDGNDGKALRGLKRDLAALVAIDYFPGEAQRQARAALAALEAAANGEPATTAGEIRRLASADFQGRTWATRKNLWVDRMASAWLIRRFIDRKAKFLWLDNPKKCPKAALGFDFDGAAFTHVGGRVSFEVLAASFGLDADPALSQIAAIVHCLDVGGVPVAEAAGVEAVLAGLRAASEDDDKLLTAAARVFDGLYQHYQQEPTNG
ncbi:chromate resistance protein ChrB domain-containing protein [Sulfuritalea sp.]|uniref:chromate resistance protein ChrB domain-containing protein n=1 Tax=Sulfuritalea sp. TaxID=2480090 RepID=UPI001ACBA3D6|nr:chromate resistance protein ChrB domain-containing protein [Sulfuritalea sp.]MBN8476107.1 chromate resistance protein [Sulfuritalea sp.]